MTLEGKAALVTGASRGIGRAVAQMLAAAGVGLALDEVVARPCDVRNRADLELIVRETVDRFGRLDILVVNAGVGAYGPFLELSPEHLEEIIDVNVKGTLYAVRAALPHLLESGEADLVTIASEAGRGGAVCRWRRSTAPRSSRRLVSRARWTTSCASGESAARTSARAESRLTSRWAAGEPPEMPEVAGMMSAQDVAEVVLFALTRPRSHRILETAFRPVTESSWG